MCITKLNLKRKDEIIWLTTQCQKKNIQKSLIKQLTKNVKIMNNLTRILIDKHQHPILQIIYNKNENLKEMHKGLNQFKNISDCSIQYTDMNSIISANNLLNQNFDKFIEFIQNNHNNIIVIDHWIEAILSHNELNYKNRIIIDVMKLKTGEIQKVLSKTNQKLILITKNKTYLNLWKPILDDHVSFRQYAFRIYI